MQSAFSNDFAAVRVHTGSAAHDVASALDARALTVGTDVLFRAGAYQPGIPVGDRLLAHELAHVVQQARNLPQGGIDGGSSDPLERAADQASLLAEQEAQGAAVIAARGGSVPALSSQPWSIARQDLDAGLPSEAGNQPASPISDSSSSAGPLGGVKGAETPEPEASKCCCCVEGIDLSDWWLEEEWYPEGPGTAPYGGHFFRPVIRLTYRGTGTPNLCKLEWWEKTNIPYNLVTRPNVWTRITDPKAGAIEGWNKQVGAQCPGPDSVKLLDPPSAKLSPGRSDTRILEFRIIVTSADCPACAVLPSDAGPAQTKFIATARQTLVTVSGKLDKDHSKFEVPNPGDK